VKLDGAVGKLPADQLVGPLNVWCDHGCFRPIVYYL
jgi:hypothetical protein